MFLTKEKKPFLTKATNGYHYIYYYVNGKRNKMSTRTKNSTDANKLFAKFLKEYKLKIEGTKFFTIKEFITIFINHKKNYFSKGTINSYEVILKDFDRFLNYKLKLHEVKQEHINQYTDFLFARHLKNSSIHIKIGLLKVAFEFALKNKYVSELFDFPKITVPEHEKEFLTRQEFQELLNICESQDLNDIITVTFKTGLRLQEIINLQWQGISLENRFIILNNKTHITKTKRIRKIPLTNEAFNIIVKRFNHYQLNLANKPCNESLDNNDYVFTYNGKKWVTTTLQANFKKLVLKVFPNKKISFHNLRHSFASNLIADDVPIYTVAKFLGHASINSTQVYSHLSDESLRTAIQNIDNQDKEKVFNNN